MSMQFSRTLAWKLHLHDAAKEIPRSQLTFHEDENYFLVQVSEDAQKALGKLAGATGNASNPSSAVFTLYSFPPTKGGRDLLVHGSPEEYV